MKEKIVVITGSSRGIGFGLAEAFLERGCTVIVSGSTEESTQAACERLKQRFPPDRILPIPCDVREFQQHQSLWDEAKMRFGRVDIWINNAGVSGPILPFWKQKSDVVKRVLTINLIGVAFGTQVALMGMLEQGSGEIYSLEGMGSDGRMIAGMTLYGTTKHGLKYFNDALAKEIRDTPVKIGALRPGMVATDLILDQYKDKPEEWLKVKRIFNIIADRVEVVAPWLVDQILSNKKNGTRISYTSRWKILWRMLTMPFTRRDIFRDLGLS